jgi:cell division septation protein DedD
MSQIYEFAITKNRLIGIVAAFLVIGLLIYSAGIVTGLLVFPKTELARNLLRQQPLQPAASEPDVPIVAERRDKTEVVEPAGATPQAPDVPQARPIAAPAPAPGPPAAPSKPAAAPKGELSVLVASFQDRENADRLSRTLQRAGFGPADVSTVTKSRQTWHVVRLGPYSEWTSAQRVVDQIQDTYELQPSIRPHAEN